MHPVFPIRYRSEGDWIDCGAVGIVRRAHGIDQTKQLRVVICRCARPYPPLPEHISVGRECQRLLAIYQNGPPHQVGVVVGKEVVAVAVKFKPILHFV